MHAVTGASCDERVVVVVPCFDEATRLRPGQLDELAAAVDGCVLVVDDGSTDGTADLVREHTGHAVDVLRLERNRGKAEAVRAGLLAALDTGTTIVGYCDADFAAPVAEVARIVGVCRRGTDVVLGSRVGLMGHAIARSPWRHYTGRMFATCSSLVLGFEVYDTQCGAKAFRVDAALRAALAEPFSSRWAFDVELLGRLAVLRGSTDGFVEVPLDAWHDEAGSKLTWRSSLRAAADLVRIRRQLRLLATANGRTGAPGRR